MISTDKTEPADPVGEVLNKIRPTVAAYLSRSEDEARGLSSEAIAQRMIEALPHRSVIDVQAGPFYRQSAVQAILGVSRQAVHERVKRDRILSMVTADGTRVFPAFQFEDGSVHLRIADAVEMLFRGTDDGWTVALWLTAEHQGATAVSILKAGDVDAIDRLFSEAREDASRWGG